MRPLFTCAAAVLLALLPLGACRGASPMPAHSGPPAPAGPVAFETVVQRSIPGQSGDSLREVARDPAAWTALWARLREGSGTVLPEEPPAVDFGREMVIAAAMATQPCVSKVTVQGIAGEGGALVVDLLEEPPAPNCVCFVSERPIHVVRLPASPGPVRFRAEQGRTACGR